MAASCVRCGEPLAGRFCEACGHDSTRPGWALRVAADRTWYETARRLRPPAAVEIAFPSAYPERTVPLTRDRVTVGRRSPPNGAEPDVDLGGPPQDPGVSRDQALLLRTRGGWELVDPGSTNGVVLDDATRPIEPNRPVPLPAGTRIHVGAWTTLTLVAVTQSR